MALTPDTGDAFIREVDDEYRRERMGNLWSRYGRWLLIAIGVGLLAVGGLLYWQETQRQQADARGAALLKAQAAMAGGDRKTASGELAALTTAPEPGYRALARLSAAEDLLQAGDKAKAVAAYDALAADTAIAEPFRNFALVRSVQIQFDEMKPADVIARLRPLAQPGGPWFGSAGELTAMAYLKDGKRDLALPLMESLLMDTNVPRTIQGRTQELLVALDLPRAERVSAARAKASAAAAPAAAPSGAAK